VRASATPDLYIYRLVILLPRTYTDGTDDAESLRLEGVLSGTIYGVPLQQAATILVPDSSGVHLLLFLINSSSSVPWPEGRHRGRGHSRKSPVLLQRPLRKCVCVHCLLYTLVSYILITVLSFYFTIVIMIIWRTCILNV
jgi:hypothetical protein